jgi:hypothetical protein
MSLGWFVPAAGCLIAATMCLRPVALRQLENFSRPPRRWFLRRFTRRVSNDPIRWREEHGRGPFGSSILAATPLWAALVFVMVFSILVQSTLVLPNGKQAWWFQAMALAFLASLTVAVRSSAAISGERECQTWEAVLLTPLEIRELIDSKLQGILTSTRRLLLTYALPALAMTWNGHHDAFYALATGLVAAWVLMQFVGAAGLCFSAHAASTGQSLGATIAFGFGGAFLLLTVLWPICYGLVLVVLFLVILPIEMTLWLFQASMLWAFGSSRVRDWTIFLAAGIICGKVLSYLAQDFIFRAQRRVAERERTPYWRVGVNCSRFVETYMHRWGSGRA